jgi:hypothetical protein
MTKNCISTALTKLKKPRNEKSYNHFMAKAKTNWEKMGLDHADFPTVRNRPRLFSLNLPLHVRVDI